MRTIIWIFAINAIITAIVKLIALSVANYPFVQKYSRGEHALSVFLNAAMAAALIYLLLQP